LKVIFSNRDMSQLNNKLKILEWGSLLKLPGLLTLT
jgi:hypothetical protein